jgi:hypothetical protein
MSAPQTVIVDALVVALTGVADVGTIIRGALADVRSQVTTTAATVSIEYGELQANNQQTGQTMFGVFDGQLEVHLDVYWSGPPPVWEPKVFECAAAIWRAVRAMTLPAMAIAVRPMGHDAPEIDLTGDNQHVVLRNNYRFDLRFSIDDPEA